MSKTIIEFDLDKEDDVAYLGRCLRATNMEEALKEISSSYQDIYKNVVNNETIETKDDILKYVYQSIGLVIDKHNLNLRK